MLSENATAFAGRFTIFSMPCPPPVGTYVTLTFSAYVCGLKRLSCVAHFVLLAPGALAAAGMMYVSLIWPAAAVAISSSGRIIARFMWSSTAADVPRKSTQRHREHREFLCISV